MVAHILKQLQMASLMASRGWSYRNMGWYDDGLDHQFAQRSFVTTDCVAEYLIHNQLSDDQVTDGGLSLYVTTDQLRFSRPDGTQLPLDEVPPRLLSEVPREADLFVGVASVGNDPA